MSNSHKKKALHYAMDYLSRAQMSIAQLTIKLKNKDYTKAEIDEAIGQLVEWGYLDDSRYAASYSKSKKLKWSKNKIRMMLLGAGVDDQLASSVLHDVYSEDVEYNNCLSAAQKFLQEELLKWEKKYSTSSTYANVPKDLLIRKKIGEKLVRRGYPYSMVNRALSQIHF